MLMKKLLLPFIALLTASSLSGCGLVEGAFKAGVIFTLIIIAIIGLVIWLSRMVAIFLEKRYNVVLFRTDD